MNYEIYSEESNVIGFYDYTVMRNKIGANKENYMSREGRMRCLYFNQDINYLVDLSSQEAFNKDTYSIRIYDEDWELMILDKQSNRGGTIYRQHTYLSPVQCESILHGDIEWMKDSECLLFRDLYLQMTINQRWPGVIVDYSRQMFRLGYGGDYLIFDTAIESTYDIKLGQLSAPSLACSSFNMERRLEPGKVVMTYHQEMGMPKVLANIMDMSLSYRLSGSQTGTK